MSSFFTAKMQGPMHLEGTTGEVHSLMGALASKLYKRYVVRNKIKKMVVTSWCLGSKSKMLSCQTTAFAHVSEVSEVHQGHEVHHEVERDGGDHETMWPS